MPAPLSLGGYGTTGSNVTLRFTNLKTKATVDLTVTGKWWTACSGRSGDGFTGIWGLCNGSSIVFDTNLTETELRKLPYGGVWVAQMQLKTMLLGQVFGEVVTDIRLNVRSEASISIPNPTVKLPVTMTGHSEPVTVDTCLFDGTGAGDSSRYELRLDDISGAARGDLFALKMLQNRMRIPFITPYLPVLRELMGIKRYGHRVCQKSLPAWIKFPSQEQWLLEGRWFLVFSGR